jgi:dTMP kinase
MFPNLGPGKFIAMEGLDGAGSTTQTLLLAQEFKSNLVYVTHEPSDGPIGLQIRMALEHRIRVDSATLAGLFAADRMDHLFHPEGLVSRLERGVTVLTDRYYLSSFAYQGMSLDWQWIWTMHAQCLQPDVTIFIDVPVEVCLERIAAGRGKHVDLFETRETLVQTRESYLRAIDRLSRQEEVIEIVDGDAPSDRVHRDIWARINFLT